MVVIPVRIDPFLLERFFAKSEFDVRYTLTSSDCEPLSQAEVLDLADDETRRLWDELKLGYTEYRGLPPLREEIARTYEGIEPDQVLVAAPEECIFIALNCILEKGDHVICTYPGYQSLYQIARWLGCEVDLWEPDESSGWRFDVGFLRERLRPNTGLVVVNFPHNPTGALPPVDDFLEVVKLARERGIHLFSDEMYRCLELDEGARLPAACGLYDRAVSLAGMSKSFGMAGVRLGWLATADCDLYDRMSAFKDYTTICAPAPSEVLSLIALRAREAVVGRHLERIRRNLELLDSFFDHRADLFAWNRPTAGSIAFPRLLAGLDSPDFCADAMEEAGILLLPSTVFDYRDRHFRVGFGREDMPEVLLRFDEYLEKTY